jgi:hypothetical protein
MDKQPQSRAPLIVAIVLLLLLPYVASYLAMVVPGGIMGRDVDGTEFVYTNRHYWVPGSYEQAAATLFWPLEQIDRRVRPWDEPVWSAP